jgi:YidC/Oxa1 family membrane protein insertase
MDRGSLLRWVFIGIAVLLFLQYGLPALTGQKDGARQPLAGLVDDAAAPDPRPEQLCTVKGPRFAAELTTKGGALRHAWMLDDKYQLGAGEARKPIDLGTTWVPSRLALRTNLRNPLAPKDAAAAQLVRYDDLDWELAGKSERECIFRFEDDQVALHKTVTAGERPFELLVALEVRNKSDKALAHRASIEQTDWRTNREMQGSWGRISEHLTETVLRAGGATHRFTADDFEPGDFGDEGFTAEKWRRAPGNAGWAGVSSAYFSKAVIHLAGPAAPWAEALVEQVWRDQQYKRLEDDPEHGFVFRSRLAYPAHELAPGATASYQWLAYTGPKERAVLAATGGHGHDAAELLDLGTFGWIGKILIRYLYLLRDLVGAWGWAICLLTVTVRILLLPLSIPQIKSSMQMRKLKPEMDALNEKYKNDATARGLALQELWRKNKVTNPMLGCVPILLQMPVWFALYTALQTAVELYHTPFGPLIPDLSAPDRFYVIPFVLGGLTVLQQHLMPIQGGDPMQQKILKYVMPIVFTAMMFFLPAGLGIYFMTNSVLGIGQQLLVEHYYKAQDAAAAAAPSPRSTGDGATKKGPNGGGQSTSTKDGDGARSSGAEIVEARAFGKGKSRVQQRG